MGRYENIRLAVFGDYMWDQWLEPSEVKMCPGQPARDFVSPFKKTEKPGGAGNQAMNVLSLGGGCCAFFVRDNINETEGYCEKMFGHISDAGGWVATEIDPNFTPHFKRYYTYQGVLLDRVSNHDGVYSLDRMVNLVSRFKNNIEQYQGVVIADYNKGSMYQVVIQGLMSICFNAGVPVFVDPKFDNWDCYKGATIFKPNQQEWKRNRTMIEVENMVITKSGDGMAVLNDECRTGMHIPARSGEVYDINGAGDSVMAAMALEYIKTDGNILQAAHVGNIAGGICVGHRYTYQVTEEDLRKAGAWND